MSTQLERTLEEVYGEQHTVQYERYQRALLTFRELYGAAGEIHLFRAPGRVNLIGEHTDYNHGYVMPAALDKDVVLLARPRSDGMVQLQNMEAAFPAVTFPVAQTIPPAAPGDWGNYARGVFQVFGRFMNQSPCGMDLLVQSAPPHGVPRGAGLSSSTAFTVAIATALCTLADWHVAPAKLIQLCSDSEWYIGTRGGIMDQFAALFGRRGHVLFLDCRQTEKGDYRYQPMQLPQGTQLLVVDSGVHHENARGEFNQRVAACRAGVGILRQTYPNISHLRDVQTVPWNELADQLPTVISARELSEQGISLGELPNLDHETPLRVQACCRHVWTENQRVILASDALETRNASTLGNLLDAAHASARDDYQISCPEIEFLVEQARAIDGVYGARLTGAGWGGSIVALVEREATQEFTGRLHQRYIEATGLIPAIFPCSAGPGAGVVGRV